MVNPSIDLCDAAEQLHNFGESFSENPNIDILWAVYFTAVELHKLAT